ncbi:MAG: YbhB/YbcL family Raf kinase inhibitor-like protein, partial [Planctomycetota bacterium]
MKALRIAAVAALTALAAAGCGGNGPADAPSGRKQRPAPPSQMEGTLELISPAFRDGAEIPTRYTCDGDDVSPPLEISGVPDEAASLALVVDDPDAPGRTFVHWVAWNIPPDTSELPEGKLPAGREGTNSFGETGYGGPCPPEGDGPHTYRFKLHALDAKLDLEAGAGADALYDAMDGHILDRTVL